MATQRLRDEGGCVDWGRGSRGCEVKLDALMDLKTIGNWANVRCLPGCIFQEPRGALKGG